MTNKTAKIDTAAASVEDTREVWELIPAVDELNDFSEVKPLTKAEIKAIAKAAQKSEKATAKANREAAQAAKATKKAAAQAEKEKKWLAGAIVNDDGKYQIMIDRSYANYDKNPNWNPTAYIWTENGFKRIGLAFAFTLAANGKAIEITKEQIKDAKKAEKEKDE